MRVLILGAGGMLGHKLMQRFLARGFAVAGTLRAAAPDPILAAALPGARLVPNVAAEETAALEAASDAVRPQAVVNCIGIIKQLDAAKDPIPSIGINALFPHRLAQICGARGIRVIHFSTDCVFSGEAGPYKEDSVPDARDLYGRTKLLGELACTGALTIRSSIIGHELHGHRGLIDWFISQAGKRVGGFARALYSGLVTPVMADLVATILTDWPELHGVWQIAADEINKYDLLCLVRDAYGLDIAIDRDEVFLCDRRLDGTRFHAQTGWAAPSWPDMVRIMHEDAQTSAGAGIARAHARSAHA